MLNGNFPGNALKFVSTECVSPFRLLVARIFIRVSINNSRKNVINEYLTALLFRVWIFICEFGEDYFSPLRGMNS